MDIDLLAETRNALHQVKEVEYEIQRQADNHGINYLQMQYHDGSMAMTPVLLAKSQLLATLYAIQRDKKQEEMSTRVVEWFTGLGDQQKFLDKKDES